MAEDHPVRTSLQSGMAIANFDGFDVEHAPPLRWYHYQAESEFFRRGRRWAHHAAAEGIYDQ